MPSSPATPTYRSVLIVGRPGGGADGANGGVCFYDHGEEFRLEPGEIADVPVKIAASLIADGLASDPDDVDPDAGAEVLDLPLAPVDPDPKDAA